MSEQALATAKKIKAWIVSDAKFSGYGEVIYGSAFIPKVAAILDKEYPREILAVPEIEGRGN